MKNKNTLHVLIIGLFALGLVGCYGDKATPGPAEETASLPAVESQKFSLRVIQTPKPTTSGTSKTAFIEKVEAPVQASSEVVLDRLYADFDSAQYAALKKDSAFALFFTKEDCTRCGQIDNFLSRNLSIMPNKTKILKVTWGEYPNLQTDFSVKRPGTMVFLEPSGETTNLFIPQPDRIIEFFDDAKRAD